MGVSPSHTRLSAVHYSISSPCLFPLQEVTSFYPATLTLRHGLALPHLAVKFFGLSIDTWPPVSKAIIFSCDFVFICIMCSDTIQYSLYKGRGKLYAHYIRECFLYVRMKFQHYTIKTNLALVNPLRRNMNPAILGSQSSRGTGNALVLTKVCYQVAHSNASKHGFIPTF